MRQDQIYADIQKKKLWMYLARINASASTAPTELGVVKELCHDCIGMLNGLIKEIDEYQKTPPRPKFELEFDPPRSVVREKGILARVGKPVKI